MAKPKKKQTTTRQPPVSSPENEGEDFDEKLKQWLDRQEQWKKGAARAPYDGVLGTLPDWIPRGINSEFVRLRHNLLGDSVCGEKITHALALAWLERYTTLGETGRDTHIPQEIFEVIGQLARWRYIVNLGPKKGLKELGVPSAKFLGRKLGAMVQETHYLVLLRKKYPHEPVDDLYRTLRVIAQTPSSARNPTPGVCPFTTTHVMGNLELAKRGRPYPLRTFRNAISDVDKRIAAADF